MKGVWVCVNCQERRSQEESPGTDHGCGGHPGARGWCSCQGDCKSGECHMCDKDREFLGL